MGERFLCIHGHFYQPPRENPWLEAVEIEKTAAPYHDWNERITDECYAANMAARILNGNNEITSIINNFGHLSFNFGPTLLNWLESSQPEVHAAIIQSDADNVAAFRGHGPAIAQGYNHIIMPLANRRDKETQVVWGIGDFHRRFGRDPEGMWLPETAVDPETLDIMSDRGIKYVILAPQQAGRIKAPGGQWHKPEAGIDTTQAYRCPLPSGNHISIIFYHQALSHDIAFSDLLKSGDTLVERISSAFTHHEQPQLVTIATDGETYGHHHRFGEMALAYAFNKLEEVGIRITNIGEYLELHPPATDVEIIENTAWSCAHGIERWRSGCCCSTGSHPGWNQDWRVPLREAMDHLRDSLAPVFESEAKTLLTDPWAARNDYHSVIADRTSANIETFLSHWASRTLSDAEKSRALKHLEIQRFMMAAYTSCGWFFDDIGNLESILVLKQAGRALQLAGDLHIKTPEETFLNILEKARSNVPSIGTGRDVFERQVRPLVTDPARVVAHFALSSFFEEYGTETSIYTFNVISNDIRHFGAGRLRMSAGDVTVTSAILGEMTRYIFAAIYWGDHNLNAGLAVVDNDTAYQSLVDEVRKLSDRADCADCLKFLESRFPGAVYSLVNLFVDEQRKVLHHIMAPALVEAEQAHRDIYHRHHATMRFMVRLGQSAPPQFIAAAAFVLNTDLARSLSSEQPDLRAIENLLEEVKLWSVTMDADQIVYHLSGRLEAILQRDENQPPDSGELDTASNLLVLFLNSGLSPNLWRVQNIFYTMLREFYPGKVTQPEHAVWAESFRRLARLLLIRIE
ncbi:DUF3536 domain-containing protein [Dehalogenimonas sp. THU2]|uniref:DUF3536 domain-containing protein n=1 Tax=Dehalogenimonas sp. THU2 TaxID=3151121 RepID=UPI00321870B0